MFVVDELVGLCVEFDFVDVVVVFFEVEVGVDC